MTKPEDSYTAEETILRREDAIKRMLATPHQPHKTAPKNPKSASKGPKESKKGMGAKAPTV